MRLPIALTAGALLALTSTAALAGAKSVPFAGIYAYNFCKYGTSNGMTLRSDGTYERGWVSGRWTKEGNVIVIKWAIRKEHVHKVRTGKKSGEMRYYLLRTKSGRYALRYVGGGELQLRCKRLR